jgi:catechol 2,3-dioxygenase
MTTFYQPEQEMPHRPLSVLSHLELLTPDLEASVEFARDMLGMFVVAEEENSAYLRCWGDYYAYSLVLSENVEPGLGHAAWRAWNAEQLDVAVASVEASGTRGQWIESSFGHGRAYRFTNPSGHPMELFWDVDRAVAPHGEESPYPERPQRTGSHGLGVRLLDHVTVMAPDVKGVLDWLHDALDFRITSGVAENPDAPWFLGFATQCEKSHDFGFLADPEGSSGRLHHVAFWVETNHQITEAAKFLVEHGHDVDFGPGQHGIGEQNYLYFRDPVGLRYELNSGGYRNYVPDWEPVVWGFLDGPNNTFRTHIGVPVVHAAPIPPGVVGRSAEMIEGIAARG